jgi:hypothetical protein
LKTSPLIQRVHHNLWKNRWLKEAISDKTKDYFTKEPAFLVKDSLYENDNPFEVSAFANIDNSNHPSTPLYQSDSDSDKEESYDDSLSILSDSNPSTPIEHIGRQVIRYSDVNNNINMSDDGVPDDTSDHHSGSDLSNNSRVEEGPRAQYGFNGQIRSLVNADSSFFISNQKQLRLTSGQTLDHDIVRKFCDQCLANDFRNTVESLIDDVTWQIILLRAESLVADNSSKSVQKLADIQELRLYVTKKDTD